MLWPYHQFILLRFEPLYNNINGDNSQWPIDITLKNPDPEDRVLNFGINCSSLNPLLAKSCKRH